MLLQIVSDIHLEFRKEWFPPKIGDSIALLGDIGYVDCGNYSKLLDYVSANYEHVFLIAGNHEYYNYMPPHLIYYLTRLVSGYYNVHFLNNSSIVVDGIRFVGTTLWSHIPYEHGWSVMSGINDYRYIIGSHYEVTNQWHATAVNYLKEQLEDKTKTVVLTHHSPLFEYEGKFSYAYGTDLSSLFKPWLQLWAHGHTHQFRDEVHNQTRIVSNPLGYPKEATGFDSSFVVKIE